MDFDRDKHGRITANPIAEVIVHAESGEAPVMRLVYASLEEASGVSALQVTLTPLQSLRLARELLAIAEHDLQHRPDRVAPRRDRRIPRPTRARRTIKRPEAPFPA